MWSFDFRHMCVCNCSMIIQSTITTDRVCSYNRTLSVDVWNKTAVVNSWPKPKTSANELACRCSLANRTPLRRDWWELRHKSNLNSHPSLSFPFNSPPRPPWLFSSPCKKRVPHQWSSHQSQESVGTNNTRKKWPSRYNDHSTNPHVCWSLNLYYVCIVRTTIITTSSS